MSHIARISVLLLFLAPSVSSACSCGRFGIHQDTVSTGNLFFGKILSAKANEVWVKDRFITTSVTFTYRVEHVVRGKHFVGEIVEEKTGGSAVMCDRIPQIRVNEYFLANSSLGNMCGLLESPIGRISKAEREIIGMTEGGPEAVKWIEKTVPDFWEIRNKMNEGP
jgi:hypothetical protein